MLDKVINTTTRRVYVVLSRGTSAIILLTHKAFGRITIAIGVTRITIVIFHFARLRNQNIFAFKKSIYWFQSKYHNQVSSQIFPIKGHRIKVLRVIFSLQSLIAGKSAVKYILKLLTNTNPFCLQRQLWQNQSCSIS